MIALHNIVYLLPVKLLWVAELTGYDATQRGSRGGVRAARRFIQQHGHAHHAALPAIVLVHGCNHRPQSLNLSKRTP